MTNEKFISLNVHMKMYYGKEQVGLILTFYMSILVFSCQKNIKRSSIQVLARPRATLFQEDYCCTHLLKILWD